MSQRDVVPPVWRTRGIPALLAVTAAGFAGYAVLLPVAPLWAVRGGAGSAGAGLVNGALLLATVATQGLVPRLLRRHGTGRTLTAGLLLLGGPSLLYLVSDGLAWILAMSVLRGLGFGALTVIGSTTVANLATRERHGAAVGAYGAAIAVPQLLLLPAGTWLTETVGFWVVFVLGTFPLLGAAAVPARVRASRRHQDETARAPVPRPGEALGAAGGTSRARQLVPVLGPPTVLLLGITLPGGALITFVPQMSSVPAATTAGLALLTAMAALSRWRFGALADRYGARVFLVPLVLLTVVALGLAALSVDDPADTRVPWLLLAMLLVGVSYGGLQSLTLLLSLAAVRDDEYATASAVWNIGFDAGTGLGSVLVGALAAGFSFPSALLVTAGVSCLTLPLAVRRRRPERSP